MSKCRQIERINFLNVKPAEINYDKFLALILSNIDMGLFVAFVKSDNDLIVIGNRLTYLMHPRVIVIDKQTNTLRIVQ